MYVAKLQDSWYAIQTTPFPGTPYKPLCWYLLLLEGYKNSYVLGKVTNLILHSTHPLHAQLMCRRSVVISDQ